MAEGYRRGHSGREIKGYLLGADRAAPHGPGRGVYSLYMNVGTDPGISLLPIYCFKTVIA